MNGICGICANRNVGSKTLECMFRLQHRGQQHCGIAATQGSLQEEISAKAEPGMVLPSINKGALALSGNYCMGVNSSGAPQPIRMSFVNGVFAIGFDGFVADSSTVRSRLFNNGFGLRSDDQTELLAGMITEAKDVETGLTRIVTQLNGPFAIMALTPTGIYVARDSQGMKPLVLGKGDHAWAAASESCAFYGTSLKLIRDVGPGEVVFFDEQACETVLSAPKQRKVCCFEWVYFARPDSVIEGVSVTKARHELGRYLAEADNVDVDVVAPVPFSGIIHAEGYHLASRIPSVEVFMPPRYLGRTYIRPYDQRVAEHARKLVPVPENVKGKRILLVDDSIRAGVTMKGIVSSLREAGAKEVHVRIASPVSTCDCPHTRPPAEGEQFIGRTMTVEQIKERIGADSLAYQQLDKVAAAIGLPASDLCLDCFL